jgi:DNA-binding Xre family transcriptional regulator
MKRNPTNLAKMCRFRHLLQRELSEKANVNTRMVQDLCNGSRNINKANAAAVCALAAALECDVADILETETDASGNKIIIDGERILVVKKNNSFNRLKAYAYKIEESRSKNEKP